ncbi:MAG TPA: hypothetical protein VLT47_11230 [Anaeromyxobacteraceae bacterium]|nr:hypothetical protein [Anaeromyxobacteraceae bacterium]
MTLARRFAIDDVAEVLYRLGTGLASPQTVEALAWWIALGPCGLA